MEMRILSIVNQKGGCGKTTTAINLSACLASKGNLTLLIDLDPQAHSSIGLNVDVDELEKSTYDTLKNPAATSLEEIARPVGENLFLAPSQLILSTVEHELAGTDGREHKLRQAVEALERPLDFVIIDCPPQLGLLTFSALIACREVIIPIEASVFSLHGVAKLLETIACVVERYDRPIKIRALATMYDGRTNLAREVLEEMHKHFGKDLINTRIRSTVKLREAAGFGKPIVEYERKCNGFCDYLALAEEMISLGEDSLEVMAVKAQGAPIEQTWKTVPTRFTIQAPYATEVRLVGDFNRWSLNQGKVMERDERGVWMTVVPLQEGEHQYRFMVDGKWTQDPDNPRDTENAFGELNSVITVNGDVSGLDRDPPFP
jgi:chromosome partitioning protein